MNLNVDDHCFACGQANPIGLHLVFALTPEGATAQFTPTPAHQGFVGIVHGGILSTLMDEAMAQAIIGAGYHAVTARITIDFKKPAQVGQPLTVTGKIVEHKHQLLKATAEIRQAGELTAKADAAFLISAPC